MQQIVLCNGCGNQLVLPESPNDEPASQFLHCNNCGQEHFWDAGLTDNQEPLLLFTVPDGTSPNEPGDRSGVENNSEVESISSEGLQASILPEESLLDGYQLELDHDSVSLETDIAEPVIRQPISGQSNSANEDSVSVADWSVLATASHPRRKRPETSGFRKIIPPILGGLSALPLATLILWYGFGRDLGSAGPTVAKYVPWIVPEKFRELPSGFARHERASQNSNSMRLPTVRRERASTSDGSATEPKRVEESKSEEPIGLEEPKRGEQSSSKPQSDRSFDTDGLKPDESPNDSTQSISETIAKLQTLQADWDSTPAGNRAMQLMMVGRYCKEIRNLSQRSAELKGRSAAIWWKQIDALSREILSHSKITTVVQHSSTGKWPGVPRSLPDEFVATALKIGPDNTPLNDAPWRLKETWRYADSDIAIEIQPGAWRLSGQQTPGPYSIVFGKLTTDSTVKTETGHEVAANKRLVLKAHAILSP